jgi:tetratricopeptide (TPR) repeat protein
MGRLLLSLAILVGLATPGFADGRHGAEAMAIPKKPPAEIRADRLDVLFAKLHRGTDAQASERDIWAIWMTSDSPTAEVLLQQATRAMDAGALDQSRLILDRLIGAYPDFAEAWNKRATLNFVTGRYDESLADIDKVLELEPRHFGALSGRGMIYERQKKYGQALDAFLEALAINPNMDAVKDAVKALEKLETPI